MNLDNKQFMGIGKSLRGAWGVLLAAFLISHFSFLISSCTSIDCPVKNMVITNYALMKASDQPDTLNTDTLWIWSKRVDGSDTLLLNALCGTTATKFSLQISYAEPEDVYYTLLADTSGQEWLDTFRIKKENYPHFESVDCKASYFHDLMATATTHHAIDSITIHHKRVDYEVSPTHLYIYLKAKR